MRAVVIRHLAIALAASLLVPAGASAQRSPFHPQPGNRSPFSPPQEVFEAENGEGDEVQEFEPDEGLEPEETLPPLEYDEDDQQSVDELGDGDGAQAGELPPMDDGDGGSQDAKGLPPMDEAGGGGSGSLQFIATAALGVGSRAFQRPTFRGLQKLPDTPFAAALVSFRTRVWPDEALSLEFLLVYRSSLGLVIREQPLFALPQDVSVRVSSSELSVAPTLRLGDGPGAPSVAVPMGLSMRTLWPAQTQYQTPGYFLLGPHLRAEFILPFADIARLRVGPEIQWVAYVDETLQDDGVVGDGVAVAGELGLSASLSPHVALELAYREARAYASSTGPLFIDVERFATVGVSGSY